MYCDKFTNLQLEFEYGKLKIRYSSNHFLDFSSHKNNIYDTLFSFFEFFWWHHNLEKITVNILQNIFCVLRKKESHTDLEHYV